MDQTAAVLRFLMGAIAAAVLDGFLLFALPGLIPAWAFVALPLTVGFLAIAFGDQFLVTFLRIFRWLQ